MSLSLFSQVAPHDLGDLVSKQTRFISGKDQGGQAQIGGLFPRICTLPNTGWARDDGGSLGNTGRHKSQVLYQRRVSCKYNTHDTRVPIDHRSCLIRNVLTLLLVFIAHKYGQRWRQTLLLPALHVCRRHRKYQESVQRLPGHYPADAPAPIRAFVTSFLPMSPVIIR